MSLLPIPMSGTVNVNIVCLQFSLSLYIIVRVGLKRKSRSILALTHFAQLMSIKQRDSLNSSCSLDPRPLACGSYGWSTTAASFKWSDRFVQCRYFKVCPPPMLMVSTVSVTCCHLGIHDYSTQPSPCCYQPCSTNGPRQVS